jgi:hypothetical protein
VITRDFRRISACISPGVLLLFAFFLCLHCFTILITPFSTFRIPLPVDPVVLPLSQTLAFIGTGPLTFANPRIWNKPPATITTPPLCHLKSPLPEI